MKKIILSTLLLSFITFSCKQDVKEINEDSNEKNEILNEVEKLNQDVGKASILISKLTGSPLYEEASISLDPLIVDAKTDTAAIVDFKFNISNYDLGAQTLDAETKGLANSPKGQHIHFILDNGPYSAHYEPEFSKEIQEGHHVLLAFLSRSYHESVKNAFLVKPITVGTPEGEAPDLTAPHLFYSRPKGTYTGKDTENLLLDFFLVNTEISATGNKVKATIEGQEFMLTEWAPYVINGLGKGEKSIRLQLLDKDNNPIPGPFNDVQRTVVLN